jgi:hypothetical protein
MWTWVILAFVAGIVITGFLTSAAFWDTYPNPPGPSPYAFALAVLLTAILFGVFVWAAMYSHNDMQRALRASRSDPNTADAAVPWAMTDADRAHVLETYLTLKSPLTMLTSAIVLAVMLVFLSNIVVPGNENMLNRLQDPDYARGIITYLFAVGTIGVIILVVFATLTRRGTGDADDLARQREQYERSKTFVSLLLGIFGTIVGFYYGQTTDEDGPTVQVAELSVPDTTLAPGDTVSVNGVVTGGTPPYFVVLRAGEDVRAVVVDEVGNFADTVPVPPAVLPEGESDASIPFAVEARDSEGGVFRTLRYVRVTADTTGT